MRVRVQRVLILTCTGKCIHTYSLLLTLSLYSILYTPLYSILPSTLLYTTQDYALSIGVLKLLLPQYFGGLDADLVTTVEANSAKKLYKEDSHLKRGAR